MICLLKIFLRKVHPYKKLLKHQLYENLLVYHLDPESEIPHDVLLLRIPSRKCGSKIINTHIISLISKWIDKVDISSKNPQRNELYLPYEFKINLHLKHFIHCVMVNVKYHHRLL